MHYKLKICKNKRRIQLTITKLRSNTTYIDSLNTLIDREDQNYEENEAIRPTGVHVRKLEEQIGRIEPPGTKVLMVIKQYTLTISKDHKKITLFTAKIKI